MTINAINNIALFICNWRGILLIASLFMIVPNLMAQRTLTVNQFLGDLSRDELITMHDQKLQYLNTHGQDLPKLEKLEFRTETNDFDLNKQEFLLRATPNSSRNIKTQRQYKATERTLVALEMELAWSKELKRRYDLLVDYIAYKDALAAEQKKQVLYKDRVLLLERSASSQGFDILDLIEARDELDKNQQSISDIEIELISTERMIALMNDANAPVTIDMDRLLDVQFIEKTIAKYQPSKDTEHPQLKVHSAALDKDLLEYELEANKHKFSIGFIQAKYGSGPDNLFRESFSVGVGFDIPLSKSINNKLTKYDIDIIASEGEYSRSIKIHERLQIQSFHKLKNLVSKYKSLQGQIGDNDAERVLKSYSRLAAANPIALLKLRENTLQKEHQLVNLKSEMIKTFINYLDIIGQLGRKPRRNYLYKDESYF